mgnify:CR=1 FL=1
MKINLLIIKTIHFIKKTNFTLYIKHQKNE